MFYNLPSFQVDLTPFISATPPPLPAKFGSKYSMLSASLDSFIHSHQELNLSLDEGSFTKSSEGLCSFTLERSKDSLRPLARSDQHYLLSREEYVKPSSLVLGVYELFTPSLSVPVREFQHSGDKEGTGKENKTQSEGEELPTPTADYQLLTLPVE